MSDDAIRVSGPINAAGLEMTLETGKLAQLADGAVVTKVGTRPCSRPSPPPSPEEGIDFFPLTVDVEERMYAAGKIPGSFFRREGRPGEQAILTAGSPTVRCARPSLTTSATRYRSSPRSSASTWRTPTTLRRSTAHRPRSRCRASRSTARSAPCASHTAKERGSRIRRSRRATSRPSRSSWRAVGSTTATSRS